MRVGSSLFFVAAMASSLDVTEIIAGFCTLDSWKHLRVTASSYGRISWKNWFNDHLSVWVWLCSKHYLQHLEISIDTALMDKREDDLRFYKRDLQRVQQHSSSCVITARWDNNDSDVCWIGSMLPRIPVPVKILIPAPLEDLGLLTRALWRCSCVRELKSIGDESDDVPMTTRQQDLVNFSLALRKHSDNIKRVKNLQLPRRVAQIASTYLNLAKMEWDVLCADPINASILTRKTMTNCSSIAAWDRKCYGNFARVMRNLPNLRSFAMPYDATEADLHAVVTEKLMITTNLASLSVHCMLDIFPLAFLMTRTTTSTLPSCLVVNWLQFRFTMQQEEVMEVMEFVLRRMHMRGLRILLVFCRPGTPSTPSTSFTLLSGNVVVSSMTVCGSHAMMERVMNGEVPSLDELRDHNLKNKMLFPRDERVVHKHLSTSSQLIELLREEKHHMPLYDERVARLLTWDDSGDIVERRDRAESAENMWFV